MIVEGNDGRMALNMTRAEALDLVTKLTKGIAQADKTGAAWFAEGVTYEANGKQFAGRVTFRVEG